VFSKCLSHANAGGREVLTSAFIAFRYKEQVSRHLRATTGSFTPGEREHFCHNDVGGRGAGPSKIVGKSPSNKRSHNLNDCNFLGKIIREYKYLTDIADEESNERPWSCWLRNFEFCKANGYLIHQVEYRNDVRNMGIVGW
jgi:hypothetical protein